MEISQIILRELNKKGFFSFDSLLNEVGRENESELIKVVKEFEKTKSIAYERENDKYILLNKKNNYRCVNVA